MFIATIVFFVSLLGIAGLFGLKYWELSRERIIAENLRARGDRRAEQLKELMIAAEADLEKLPPTLLRLTRILIHEAALAFAALARLLERGAHRLADLVSHKRGFEKRDTRSEFLRKVSEHKNGGEESDSDDVAPELDEFGR